MTMRNRRLVKSAERYGCEVNISKTQQHQIVRSQSVPGGEVLVRRHLYANQKSRSNVTDMQTVGDVKCSSKAFIDELVMSDSALSSDDTPSTPSTPSDLGLGVRHRKHTRPVASSSSPARGRQETFEQLVSRQICRLKST